MSPEPLLVLAGCVVLAALLVLLARRNRRRPRVQLPPVPTRPPHIDVSPVAAAVHPALHPSAQPSHPAPPPAVFPTANARRVGADPAYRARPGWTPPQPNRAAPSPADSTTTVMPPVAPPYGRHAAKVPGGGNVIELLRANGAIRL